MVVLDGLHGTSVDGAAGIAGPSARAEPAAAQIRTATIKPMRSDMPRNVRTAAERILDAEGR